MLPYQPRGKDLNFEELKVAALQIMSQLGYKRNSILLYSHSDTNNNHVHIISLRLDRNGKKIRDTEEGIREAAILNKILGIDHEMELKTTIGFAKSYSRASHSQFGGLVESKGFKAIRTNEGYNFHNPERRLGYFLLIR